MDERAQEYPIVKCILERGLDEASRIHGFKINKTGVRRPDKRSKKMKAVVNLLESLGYRW